MGIWILFQHAIHKSQGHIPEKVRYDPQCTENILLKLCADIFSTLNAFVFIHHDEHSTIKDPAIILQQDNKYKRKELAGPAEINQTLTSASCSQCESTW